MSLQLIYGSSGVGKSHYLYEEIIKKSMEEPQGSYLFIVPEQFSMETQKDVVRLHPNRGVMNIDILSFGRLAYRIFEETGSSQLPVLDDTGKNLVLRRILEEKKKELTLYAGKMSSPGFVSEIKSVLSEFFQYGIHESEMEAMLSFAGDKPMLRAKLQDMEVIRKAFVEDMEHKYVTKEEILEVLIKVVHKSAIIKNSIICFDGFTGFTPIQYKLLGLLMQHAKKVMVTVTMDGREEPGRFFGEQELFHLSKMTVYHLRKLAKETKTFVEQDIRISEPVPRRFLASLPLAFLEANLFRYPHGVYDKPQEDISIHVSKNPMEEAAFTAREIWKLIRDEGLRYRDIAVISGDMGRYGDILREVFSLHQIPCFIDHKPNIMGNPFVTFIRNALMVIKDNYSYEAVFGYLKSGLTDMDREDIDYLENYCLALGIRGRNRWSELWVRSYKKKMPADISYLNGLREQVFQKMESLALTWKDKEATVKMKMTALHGFIREHGIQEKLSDYAEAFRAEGKLSLAKEYAQTYRLVMELFDKVVELLGKECMDFKELTAILDSGFEEIKVGLIPPAIDQVLVGDMERTRLKDIKALFFLGINDGLIPGADVRGGLLSQAERTYLKEHDIILSPTARENAYIQKFYLYLNLTKPSMRLYLSYAKTASVGGALRPSYLIGTLKKLFPSIKETDEERASQDMDYMTTPEGALPYWLTGLSQFGKQEETVQWKELYSWYLRDKAWKEKVALLAEAAFYQNREKGIGRLAAARLYGPQPINSVTRLERFSACAFAHFLTYGLSLEKRSEYQILSMDMGNMFHNAIERYSKKLTEEGLTFSQVSEDMRKQLVKESVSEVTTDYGNSILTSNARNSYLINRLERITLRTVWALGEQLKKGRFTPVSYEVAFSEQDGLDALTIPVSSGDTIRLKGRIDRMDLYEDEENVYVKIIDYKSGGTTFDLPSVYYGLQLQLVVYLDASMEMEKKNHPGKLVIPAGIFYYNIKDPVIEKLEGQDENAIREGLLKELRMNGLANKSSDILKLMDNSGDATSQVIPVAYNKDGSLKKTSQAVTGEQFAALTGFVREKIRGMGQEILSGDTRINPYEKGRNTACDFCDYRFVCGFDKGLMGYEFRRLKELKPEEVWRIIDGKEEKENGHGMDERAETGD